jgi:threonine dehydrogenase-like Zn-dependent dehydrogenase
VTHAAVTISGPDQLRLERAKPTPRPGPTQILARVECVGLCFSDLKLLAKFADHPRKAPLLDGADDLGGHVPGAAPTVPGHEAVLRVVEVGSAVSSVRVGGRYVVQGDFRHLRTATSSSAFGYGFEGALQEYVLIDERATIGDDGRSHLLPAPEDASASRLALTEPWACLEGAFGTAQRQRLRPGGTVLLAGGCAYDIDELDLSATGTRLFAGDGPVPPGFTRVELDAVPARAIDDLLLSGSDPDLVERTFPLLADDGLMLLGTHGQPFGRDVVIQLGRVHYGNVRIVAAGRFAEALSLVPPSSEIRGGDHVLVVGAGGPMGTMAMLLAIARSRPDALVEGCGRDAGRLSALRDRIGTPAVRTRIFDAEREQPDGAVDYSILMAPELVGYAIRAAAPGGIINMFASPPAEAMVSLDLDAIAAKRLYLLGTSGSTVDDMQAVLRKAEAGEINPDISVGAVAGLAGAIAGYQAVRDRRIAGKVIVYPELVDCPLTTLAELAEAYPSMAPMLAESVWSAAAERELATCFQKAVTAAAPATVRTSSTSSRDSEP